MSNLFSQFILGLLIRAIMRKLMLILLFFVVSVPSMAQIIDNESHTYETVITGNVSDNNGLPLTGADLVLKGTTKKTSTNFDGNFSLGVEGRAILIISHAGFKTIELAIENQTKINVTLEEEIDPEHHNPLATRPEPHTKTRSEIRKARRANRVKHPFTTNDGLEIAGDIVKAIMKNNR